MRQNLDSGFSERRTPLRVYFGTTLYNGAAHVLVSGTPSGSRWTAFAMVIVIRVKVPFVLSITVSFA
ncbi:uncharacterized protein N7483_002842 [Penicillium malachiteum]|uniref:uncharacterized protein n=1 Tax=Penicillium malachiteum TaxID=1324776 RepID=UPI002547CAF3|nr:uncharacterized protein N7483_002842 [Penicillium malachiteum]KAJ5737717.1 hypothetical protein N7483_002842 [Penicillium malachiteum]